MLILLNFTENEAAAADTGFDYPNAKCLSGNFAGFGDALKPYRAVISEV